MAAIRENTLLSFATAAAMGTDFIEFDVMLSSDSWVLRPFRWAVVGWLVTVVFGLSLPSVPVVYHDFALETDLVEETGSDTFSIQLGLHQLSSRALSRVAQHHIRPVKKSLCKLAQLMCKHWHAIVALAFPGGRVRKPKSCKWLQALYQPPSLASMFDSVPAHVGLDVEIKYPTELQHACVVWTAPQRCSAV
jgi:glycerophosphoryl diester phosphodiesterase